MRTGSMPVEQIGLIISGVLIIIQQFAGGSVDRRSLIGGETMPIPECNDAG